MKSIAIGVLECKSPLQCLSARGTLNSMASENGKSPMIEIERPPVIEKAVLVRLILPADTDEEVEESLQEMERLAWTAGADVVCTITQRRNKPCSGTLIGKGKAEEIRLACDELEAEAVLFDSDLTPAQGSNLEEHLGRKVVDRTQLILDIFAQRAQTTEGKHQVELAQLQYILPRLAGRGSIMRQQGGIGVRGPGEQKLEVDRRVIRTRIGRLKAELEKVRKHRRVQRKRREETGVATVALVGYTNAGKSSLLNKLTGAEAFVEDKLFATLDPTTRRCAFPSGREVLFSDTVGFVRKLPHSLVAAFRATLEEVNDAHLLALVADASHPAASEHIAAVYRVLSEIGADDKPIVHVFNKTDLAEASELRRLLSEYPGSLALSAKTGEGISAFLERAEAELGHSRVRMQLRIPQHQAGIAARLHANARVYSEEYAGNMILLDVEVEPALAQSLAEYRVEE